MDFEGVIECNHIGGAPLVKYTLRTCPRCLGKGWYGGITNDSSGEISTIEKSNYLEQAIRKILISKMNRSGYGFNYDLLSGVIDEATIPFIKYEILRCLTFLQKSQQEDKQKGVSYLPSEEIAQIISIDVVQSTLDLRRIEVSIALYAASQRPVTLTQSLLR